METPIQPYSPDELEKRSRLEKDIMHARKELEFLTEAVHLFADGVINKEYIGFTGYGGEPLTSEEVIAGRLKKLERICMEGDLLAPGGTVRNYLEFILANYAGSNNDARFNEEKKRLDDKFHDLLAKRSE